MIFVKRRGSFSSPGKFSSSVRWAPARQRLQNSWHGIPVSRMHRSMAAGSVMATVQSQERIVPGTIFLRYAAGLHRESWNFGMGPHGEEVRDNLLCSAIPVSVIWLVLPLETCITRALQRQKKIPAPFRWAPVEYSVPLIHDGIGFAWDIIWSREPHFHATRQEFLGTVSVDEMYSAIRKICLL
jgi:hypothetical protein